MPAFAADRLDPASYPSSVEIPVLYGDLDPNRHINNVSMGRFFEHARVMTTGSAFHDSGIKERVFFLIGRVAIDYLAEGRFGTPLVVRTRLARIGTSSMTIEQAAWQGETVVSLCEAVLVHVVDGHAAPIPEHVRERLVVG